MLTHKISSNDVDTMQLASRTDSAGTHFYIVFHLSLILTATTNYSPGHFKLTIMRLTHLANVLSAIVLLPYLALSTTTFLTISIPSSPQLPSLSTLPPSTSASLTTLSTSYTAHINAQSNFVFRNVSAGSYLLSIACASHAFAPLRVDVGLDGTVEAWRTFRGNEWENRGESVMGIGDGNGKTVEAKVLGAKGYYMERAGCEFHF
jgi:hypothetical protein